MHTNDNYLKRTGESQSMRTGRARSCGWTLCQLRSMLFITMLMGWMFLGYLNTPRTGELSIETMNISLPPDYLVSNEHCKIPNLNPFALEVMLLFHKGSVRPCRKKPPLTRIKFNTRSLRYVLRIDEEYIKPYRLANGSIPECCYKVVQRSGRGDKADMEFSLKSCQFFAKSVTLSPDIESVIVSCFHQERRIYIDGHAMIPERKNLRFRLERWRQKDLVHRRRKPPSVLLLGIDSISRLHFIRAMPKTFNYLNDHGWFEMSGYNKIGLNTYPNLMAVLTGYNETGAYETCNPTTVGSLDNCDFIWKRFRDHGYVTGFGEDETKLNTFNFHKVGFLKPPVDYYLRPFLLAAESELQQRVESHLTYCLGRKFAAEYVFDYAVELATRYKDHPIFGLFWANTFSHSDFNACNNMDKRMTAYMKELALLGILNRSVVIFFSDHGLRFGDVRKTLSGSYEERLPFMFMWLPPSLKHQHPEFVEALRVNKNRLTNPYDLHMTLKHLLALGGRVENKRKLPPAEGCARCQSLLQPVPHNRSCADISIKDKWCTCVPYTPIDCTSDIAIKLAEASIKHTNYVVRNFKNGTYAERCGELELLTVISAGVAMSVPANGTDSYRIIYSTLPNRGSYEAFLRHNVTSGAINAVGGAAFLDMYKPAHDCVAEYVIKGLCHCI